MKLIIFIVITLIIFQQQCDAYANAKKSIVSHLKSTLIEYNNNDNVNINNIKDAHTIRFQGGGIKFWFQAGCCKYLLEQKKVFNQTLIGTSAGSLSATFLALNVDFDKVAEFAIYQAKRDHLFDKPSGLLGIWGNLVREWLYYLVSDDAFTNYKNDKKKLHKR
jgi:predicted patatin/cPLA2 family phospholipase